ncbi:MAG: chromosome segregation protein SMC [Bacillota bacterium]|nr:chromosome segregation protein SMC [Bacillota bacterium]
MILKRFEVYGFKSFAERMEIRFDKGITAIVGPNGTGKSNIADAVRWVLGEQSNKSLRTQRTDDIIFGGTENRKPLSYCEVSLTFDNPDGLLAIDFSEVTVTRRAYRSGESEYFINQNPCRMKDISDLFRDTGIGREGYSVIGQGRIDEILSTRPEDRRAIFEEAAGIGKYRSRKEEAERKLDAAEQDLLRLHDVIGELEIQLAPLAKQCEEAKKYLGFKERLKELEINLFLAKYDEGQEKLDSLKSMMQGMAEECGAKVGYETQIADAIAESEKTISQREERIGAMQSKALEFSSLLSQTAGEKNLIQERIENIKKDNERILSEADALKKEAEEGSREYEESSRKAGEWLAEGSKSRETLKDVETEYKRLTDEIEKCETAMSGIQGVMRESLSRLYEEKNKTAGLEAAKNACSSRMEAFSRQLEEKRGEIEGLKKAGVESEGAAARLRSRADELSSERNGAAAALGEAKKALEALAAETGKLERGAGSIETRCRMLEAMQRDYEGYSNSVKALFREAERSPAIRERVIGAVAQLISVPEKLQKAVEMALGPAASHIVTKDEEDAKHLIGYLRENDLGRATFLPLTSMKPRCLSDTERITLKTRGCIGVASELISYDKKYAPAIESLLARTIIVENIDVGIAIARAAGYTIRVATLNGEIINPGGSMTGGSTGAKTTSILGREEAIRETKQQKEQAEAALKAMLDKKAQLDAHIHAINEKIKICDEGIKTIEIETASESGRLESFKRLAALREAEAKTINAEMEKLGSELDSAKNAISEAMGASGGLEREAETLAENEKAKKEAYESLRAGREQLFEKISALKMHIRECEQEAAGRKADAERAKTKREKALAGVSEKEHAISVDIERLKQCEASLAGIGGRAEGLQKEAGENSRSIEDAENARRAAFEEVKSLERKRAQLQEQLEQVREKSHRTELSAAKIEAELDNMANKIWEEYELTYSNAESMRREINMSEALSETENLKRSLRSLGSINPNAIEDYQNVKERYEYLTSQRDDLAKAQEDLRALIGELTGRMQSQFKEQFDLINRNFSETFKKLFGGGRAMLILSDENDLMECGIDIVAQPPGKNLKLISLSGGEKALTAIAILFAILKLKPTPFCLLDEIEAALDEANVERFSNFIKDYSKNTQFILITHRRATMANCDIIYGMAMEEKGVSKMVGVRLAKEAS